MKKKLFLLIASIAMLATITGCGKKDDGNTLTVLNYGKYLEPSLIQQFEEETGIQVEYEEYGSPEEMYAKYKAGAVSYDLLCTSDYMLERLIQEGEAQEMNYDNIPGSKNLDAVYFERSKAFDPENKYTLPHFFGTVGILYNKTMVNEEDMTSWNALWNKKYEGKIFMPNSVRDAFVPALNLLGYSSNSTDEKELREALALLKKQAPLVSGYYLDEAADLMVAGDAAMAVVYSGEAAYAQSLNEDLAYSVPQEGSNMWIDSWMITKNCKNTANAEKFLEFLCREDVAMCNFEYVYYATPNTLTYAALDEELQTDQTIFPNEEILNRCELFKCLDTPTITLYNTLWKELKSGA